MNRRAKILEAMRNNPRDWRIDDLLVDVVNELQK